MTPSVDMYQLLRMLVIINGWRNSYARGGDYHILRVLKNWSSLHDIALIIPRIGYHCTTSILGQSGKTYFISCVSCNSDEVDRSETSILKYYFLRLLRSIFLTSRGSKFDVVISSSHLAYDLVPAYLLSRKYNSKLVVYIHHILSQRFHESRFMTKLILLLTEYLSLKISKNADLVFVNNIFIKEYLVRKGFEESNIVITGNGIDQVTIREFDSKRVVKIYDACFCGALTVTKGVYDLVDVWRQVVTMHPEAKLVIIGDGAERDKIKSLIIKYSLTTNIDLLGYVTEETKYTTLMSSGLFLSCSLEEGWGIALTEAIACGLPVVCYNLPAYNVFGEAIIRTRVGDRNSMAIKICELLVNHKMVDELKSKGKELVNKFDWDDISRNELEAINRIFLQRDLSSC
jgi:glycosyltransferase involved in cell wall biosynthesis